MALAGKLMVAAILGSCVIIAIGICLSAGGDRVRGEKLMGVGVDCAMATLVGIAAFGIMLRGWPAGANAVHFWGVAALALAISPMMKWYRKRKSRGGDE